MAAGSQYYGLTQMGPQTFNDFGTLGGLTYDQYTKADPAAQIGAYNDFFNQILARNPSLNMSAYDAPTQYALRQALNFTPWNASSWLPAFLNGDYTVQTGPPQGGDMNDTSINALIQIARSRGLQ
jgi:hypothetical protein